MAVWSQQIIRGVVAGALPFMFVLACLPGRAAADGSSFGFSPVDQSWDEMSPTERERALRNFRRFEQLPDGRKQDLQEAYDVWQQLPATERERIEHNYQRYREMNSYEKEEFRLKYRHWQSQQR
jgi:hypothetical protein